MQRAAGEPIYGTAQFDALNAKAVDDCRLRPDHRMDIHHSEAAFPDSVR